MNRHSSQSSVVHGSTVVLPKGSSSSRNMNISKQLPKRTKSGNAFSPTSPGASQSSVVHGSTVVLPKGSSSSRNMNISKQLPKRTKSGNAFSPTSPGAGRTIGAPPLSSPQRRTISCRNFFLSRPFKKHGSTASSDHTGCGGSPQSSSRNSVTSTTTSSTTSSCSSNGGILSPLLGATSPVKTKSIRNVGKVSCAAINAAMASQHRNNSNNNTLNNSITHLMRSAPSEISLCSEGPMNCLMTRDSTLDLSSTSLTSPYPPPHFDRRKLLAKQSMVRNLFQSTSDFGDGKKRTRRVNFADSIDSTTDDDKLEELPPPMTQEELRAAFWTRAETVAMRKRAQNMAEDYCWKVDKRVVTCLTLLIESCSESTSSTSDSGRQERQSTMESGFQYLYSCEVPDNENDEEHDNVGGRNKQCEIDNNRTTTLRGLETFILPDLASDRRMKCIQSLLRKQDKIQHQQREQELREYIQLLHQDSQFSLNRRKSSRSCVSSSPGATTAISVAMKIKQRRAVEALLARESTKASYPARKFARLLAKVDEAVVKSDNVN